jgi:uncharacterized membrane protein (DUF441 family)
MLKNETVRKIVRIIVLIAGIILIILGGLGVSYGINKIFWLLMLLIGSVFAYALMVEIPLKKQKPGTQHPDGSRNLENK